jgi:dolichol-phosphate mannosyltransferase
MTTTVPDLSLIIPCFNESDTIETTLKAVSDYLEQKYPEMDYEILPINDGSTDETPSLIATFAEKNPRVIVGCGFETNRGRGAAIKHGISISKGEFVICLDADLSYDVDHIGEILNSFSQDPSPDVVVVSAYMRGGTVKGVPISRLILSRIANWVLSGSFPCKLSTVTCVVRGYRGKLLRSTPFFEDSKELHLEMLWKLFLRGARVVEIPGRLKWEQKKKARRKNSLNIVSSAKHHLLYGLLLKPTRVFRAIAWTTLSIAVYESIVILVVTFGKFQWKETFFHSLWWAINQSFMQSPHTFFIAGIAYLFSSQLIFFLILFRVLMMHHAENQRLLLHFGISKEQSKGGN